MILWCIKCQFFSVSLSLFVQIYWSISFRSVPTTTSSHQWAVSPILPPVSSRTPHLVPELMPAPPGWGLTPNNSSPVATTLAITNSTSHDSSFHNNNNNNSSTFSTATSDPSVTSQLLNHRTNSSWIELNADEFDNDNNNYINIYGEYNDIFSFNDDLDNFSDNEIRFNAHDNGNGNINNGNNNLNNSTRNCNKFTKKRKPATSSLDKY